MVYANCFRIETETVTTDPSVESLNVPNGIAKRIGKRDAMISAILRSDDRFGSLRMVNSSTGRRRLDRPVLSIASDPCDVVLGDMGKIPAFAFVVPTPEVSFSVLIASIRFTLKRWNSFPSIVTTAIPPLLRLRIRSSWIRTSIGAMTNFATLPACDIFIRSVTLVCNIGRIGVIDTTP